MPLIEIRIKRGGVIKMDFEGFPNSTCEQAQAELFEKLKAKGLSLDVVDEEPKQDELLQEEGQVEEA